MKAYSDLLVATCHRRGAYAIGGMAAFIPSRRDAEMNAVAFAKVRADKTREAEAGYEGSWVAHPGPGPDLPGDLRRGVGRSEESARQSRCSPVHVTAKELLDIRSLPLTVTAERPGAERRGRAGVRGELAGRQRGGGHQQPDGRRRDGGDLAVPDLAVAAQPGGSATPVGGSTAEMIVRLLDAATERLADTWADTPGGRELLADARNLLFDLCTEEPLRGLPHRPRLRAAALTCRTKDSASSVISPPSPEAAGW